ncbi:MAG: SHD1 domain-containing protein [Thermoguttaceae bacterium]
MEIEVRATQQARINDEKIVRRFCTIQQIQGDIVMRYSFFTCVVISVLLNNSVLGEESTEMPKKHINVTHIEETLEKIVHQTKDFVEVAKSIQSREVYAKPETIDNILDAFEQQYRSLIRIRFWFQLLDNAEATPLRKNVLGEWLLFWNILYASFDKEHDFSVSVYKNLAVNGPYSSGIDPKHIVEPDIRKDYEERLAKNTQLAYERRVQLNLQQLLEDATKEMKKFICDAYEREPRADDELIKAMEKHKLPENIRIEILSNMGITYKGFREWQSTDGLFKTTAKFVSLDQGDVTLEKADGKRTAIELSVLRQLDQDYVKTQQSQQPSNETNSSTP